MGLNGRLVVADGRCSLYRKKLLLPLLDRFTNEYFLGVRSEIGDDRFFTREVRKQKYRIVIQSTALVTTSAQPTLKTFLKQQLRWRRSGYKFFLKDLKEQMFKLNGKLYLYQILIYYLAPFFFIGSFLFDFFILPERQYLIDYNITTSLIFMIFGCTLVSMIRQAILFGKVDIKGSFIYGIIGFFVLFPLAVFAIFTIKKQSTWGTRGEEIQSTIEIKTKDITMTK